MRLLTKNQFGNIIEGANFLGTGGGGSIQEAAPLLKKITSSIQLIDITELKDTDLICTVFGVGGKQVVDPVVAAQKAIDAFIKITNKKISAIVSVEIGAGSVASAIFSASSLNTPLLDSDIVGMRSSPEVFLETISLSNISRVPATVSDDKGNTAVLLNTTSIEQTEIFLRNFCIMTGGDAIVAGYPMTVKQAKKVLPKNSISESEKIGNLLTSLKTKKISLGEFYKKTHVQEFTQGKIVKNVVTKIKGFESGSYEIKANGEIWTVLYKNENIVLLKNNKVVLTCPDSIILFDLDEIKGINNFENNKGKRVAILGRKAIPIWRTTKGKNLFTPEKLGFNYNQKLL